MHNYSNHYVHGHSCMAELLLFVTKPAAADFSIIHVYCGRFIDLQL